MIDEDLMKIAGEVTWRYAPGSKHVHDEDFNEDEDVDGSMIEDLDEAMVVPQRRVEKPGALPTDLGPQIATTKLGNTLCVTARSL